MKYSYRQRTSCQKWYSWGRNESYSVNKCDLIKMTTVTLNISIHKNTIILASSEKSDYKKTKNLHKFQRNSKPNLIISTKHSVTQ